MAATDIAAAALAAYDNEETLLFCHACNTYSVFSRAGHGYCPRCGSGDTGVTHHGHDSWPDRDELLAEVA